VALKGAPPAPAAAAAAASGGGYELNFRRDPSIYDGRFANNGWLQELPKPLTKLTWDNPIMIGPAMAERLKLNFKDVAELEFQGKKVKGAVWIQAGHPDNSITVFLGYGRERAGRIGTGAGFDVYPMRTSQVAWCRSAASKNTRRNPISRKKANRRRISRSTSPGSSSTRRKRIPGEWPSI
jgi:molybdopterin-containing oxidoreductase family iron-sulfur binding subunit